MPLRRAAGMAAARSMEPDSAVKAAVPPAIWRKRRRLSSVMGVGVSCCFGGDPFRMRGNGECSRQAGWKERELR
ncbi:hypothetical protein GCM10010431_22100 [Streptomyces kunmingensis]